MVSHCALHRYPVGQCGLCNVFGVRYDTFSGKTGIDPDSLPNVPVNIGFGTVSIYCSLDSNGRMVVYREEKVDLVSFFDGV